MPHLLLSWHSPSPTIPPLRVALSAPFSAARHTTLEAVAGNFSPPETVLAVRLPTHCFEYKTKKNLMLTKGSGVDADIIYENGVKQYICNDKTTDHGVAACCRTIPDVASILVF
jgi:hypothetical protein